MLAYALLRRYAVKSWAVVGLYLPISSVTSRTCLGDSHDGHLCCSYDLSELDLDPIRIETTAGKQEYAATQRAFAERTAPLRERLIAACKRLAESN